MRLPETPALAGVSGLYALPRCCGIELRRAENKLGQDVEAKTKTWGLVAGLLAILVLCLVGTRILISSPDEEQGEVLSVNDTKTGNLASRDELMNRLQQVENQVGNKRTPEKEAASRSADIERLQKQVEILAQQVTELTKVVGGARIQESAQRQEDMKLLQSAANDPVLRQKYERFQEDVSLKQHDLVKQSFQEEMVDEQWAVDSEDNIKTGFYQNNNLAGVDLVAVDCRTSMCRMSVTMPQPEANSPEADADHFIRENELLASISRDMPGASMRSQPDGKGGLRYEIFLFREGYNRPKLEHPLAGKSMSEMIEYVERY